MEKKQTAVEWLEERFQKYTDWIEGDAKATEYTFTQLCNDFAKATEMEKERAFYHFEDGYDIGYTQSKLGNARIMDTAKLRELYKNNVLWKQQS